MTDEIITITKVEDVTFNSGKTGWKFNGRFNIFDKALADQLRAGIGKAYKFDVTTDKTGKYENVRAMGSFVGDMPAQAKIEQTSTTGDSTFIPIKQNCYKWQGFEIYFSNAEDLAKQVAELKSFGYLQSAVTPQKPVDSNAVLQLIKESNSITFEALVMAFGECKGELTKLLEQGVIFEEKPNVFRYLG